MALDPRIALATTMPDIPTPDFLRTLLGASQIQQSRQQQQLQAMHMRRAQEEEAQERRLLDYLQQKYGRQGQASGGQPVPSTPADAGPITQTTFGGGPQQPGMADQVPQAPPETYVRSPSLMSQQSPFTQAPPGTTWTRAPEEMQPRPPADPLVQTVAAAQQGPPPGAPMPTPTPGTVSAPMPTQAQGPQSLDWRDLLRPEFGRKGLEYAQAMQQVEAGQSLAQQRQMETVAKQVDALEKVLPMITDQRSLDQVRAMSPSLAAALPEQYNEQQIQQWVERVRSMKSRLAQQHMGLTPIYGTQNGQPAIVFPTQAGGYVQPPFPQNFQPLGPGVTVQKGPTQDVVLDKAGNPIRTIPKDVYGGEQEKQQAQEDVKQVEEARTRLRTGQTAMAELVNKRQRLEGIIDKIFTLLKTSPTPVVGARGLAMAQIPSTNAYTVAALLEQLKGSMGLEELVSLKNAGSSLGQVTEGEHKLLQTIQASLKQGLDPAVFWEQLQQLYGTLRNNEGRRQQAYERDAAELEQRYQNIQRRGAQPSRTGGSGTAGAPQVIPRSKIKEWATKRGMSEQEIETLIRANPNYTIGD